MFDGGISSLLGSTSVCFLYIHRHISQDSGVDFSDRFFYIHTGMCFHQILCWLHMSWAKVCFYRHTGTSFCLVLCGVHSWMAEAHLCRHTGRYLHPAPCWVHRHHGIHWLSLKKHTTYLLDLSSSGCGITCMHSKHPPFTFSNKVMYVNTL